MTLFVNLTSNVKINFYKFSLTGRQLFADTRLKQNLIVFKFFARFENNWIKTFGEKVSKINISSVGS